MAKRVKRWGVISTVTLGIKPRDLIHQVAGGCDRIELNDLVSLLSSEPPVCLQPGSSLKELTSQWAAYSGRKHTIQFWQAVIEMSISLKCQRYVLTIRMEDH